MDRNIQELGEKGDSCRKDLRDPGKEVHLTIFITEEARPGNYTPPTCDISGDRELLNCPRLSEQLLLMAMTALVKTRR